MKTIKLFITLISIVATFSTANAQQLKPLKSFGGNEQEYLKENFKKGNELFKGKSFEELLKAVEARILSAEIHMQAHVNRLTIELYLQYPDYVSWVGQEEGEWRTVNGIFVRFEDGEAMEKATSRVYTTFPQAKQGKSMLLPFDKQLSDQLTCILNGVKIKEIEYTEQTFTLTTW
jgi:hypothetical protein